MGAHGAGGWTILPNGSYRVSLTMPDGRRVWRRAPAAPGKKPDANAKRILRDLVAMAEADLNPSSQTLTDFLRSWLASIRDAKHQRLGASTIDTYGTIIERHIIPSLGKHRLSVLSERHVQAWLDGDPGSPQTVKHHHAVLRRALNVALRQRLVARNVTVGVELPDVDDFVGAPLTLDEARALLDATAGDRLGILWRLALDSGLRRSELLGLARDDFERTAPGVGTLRVHSQLARVVGRDGDEGSWVRIPTKSARAAEVIALMPDTVEALHLHSLLMASERTPDWKWHGLLFVTPGGMPFQGASILDAFHAACRQAGIRERRFHDLRVSSATILRELGVPEEVRMGRLGHATKSMAQHYAHVRPGFDRAAVDAMAKALAG